MDVMDRLAALEARDGEDRDGEAAEPGLRLVAEGDLPLVAAHLLSLDSSDRFCRYHCGVTDAGLAERVRRIDLRTDVLAGAFSGGRLVGLAEAYLDAGEAEIAVTVAPGWRGRGLGRRLVALAAGEAARRGPSRARLYWLPENECIPRIARALGADVDLLAGAATFAADRLGGRA